MGNVIGLLSLIGLALILVYSLGSHYYKKQEERK